jgi:hypothetical protein
MHQILIKWQQTKYILRQKASLKAKRLTKYW